MRWLGLGVVGVKYQGRPDAGAPIVREIASDGWVLPPRSYEPILSVYLFVIQRESYLQNKLDILIQRDWMLVCPSSGIQTLCGYLFQGWYCLMLFYHATNIDLFFREMHFLISK